MNRRDTFVLAGSVRRLTVVASAAAVAAAATLLLTGGAGLGAQGGGPCDPPIGNPIVCENQKAGNPASEWDIAGAGDVTIQGFTTDISVNRGQTINFKINSSVSDYRLDIYRMGYYGGMGARKVATVNRSGALQGQPDCLSDAATGLIDCGNWLVSTTWTVPADAVSGIYFAKVVRPDTGGASHIVFVVRDDASRADVFFQTSDTTWQAYNEYGGNSLYVGAPAVNPNRAYKVSYNRPFTTRGTSPADWVFNAEYPMVRWLEANGYNVAYASGMDTDRSGPRILQHKMFMSVGHDEYWSGQQRANVEAARAAGVHLAFFSGNEIFWKTRWENSTSLPATASRTLVSYKETHANAKIDPLASVWTGAWEDPRFTPPADGGRPANALTGTLFRVNSGTTAITVPAADGRMRFWRNTSIATLTTGIATLTSGTLGFEWDEDVDNAFRPAGLVRLSTTNVSGVQRLQDYGSNYAPASASHAMTLYRHASGALVFGAGTVQWSWGLDHNHDLGSAAPSLEMQQATVNLLADMAVQPLTIQPALFVASASTDNGAPTSSITSPSGIVPANSTVVIAGTAVDAGGGEVGGVEVSADNGTTWHRAIGRESWSYLWQTGLPATVTLRSRAVDDSGNLEQPLSGTTIEVASGAATCPCSLWVPSQTPSFGPAQDPSAVELGTRFSSDSAGYVTGIRYYKSSQDTGTHTGSLWSAGGARLATVTFASQTDSGWQEATLGNPVAIVAGTTYVVSFHTDTGYFIREDAYFSGHQVDNGPLHAPQNTVAAANGVFRYGTGGFPTETYNSANYWADVVFNTSLAVDTTPPTVSSVTPPIGAGDVSVFATATATFSEQIDPATLTTVTFELRDSNGLLVPATVTPASDGVTATLLPVCQLAYATTYTAKLRSGGAGVKDTATNPLAVDVSWSFTTVAPPAPPPTTGPGGPILVITSSTNPFSVYYAEILRAEGLNSFGVADLATVTTPVLDGYDVVILGEMPLTDPQAAMLADWVTAGGNLIAMRPDKRLAPLLGLTDVASTSADAYLLVNTAVAPGAGIVGQTMQFHGAADLYALNGATEIARLYASAASATTNPAITIRSVGSAGGQAAAFTYDLAKSVVYTRQGNPAWAGQDRDANPPIRSDDLFFGVAQPDYVDRSKVAIPQADEQQRLLANLIGFINADRKPLPKFWYLPRGLKAVVVMTGDDHANNGTLGRFNIYSAESAAGCSVADWECIRATSYMFPNTPISANQVAALTAQGFEIGVHMWMSGLTAGSDASSMDCHDFTPASIAADYSKQLSLFSSLFPSSQPIRTNRTHCIVWSDYTTQAEVALANGIRLDTNYYYWPDTWVNNVPGLFTGSGLPMRFAKIDGTMIDVYQATSQMTDESGQSFPLTVDTLLDRALGPEGYYGAFVANMHTDTAVHPGSEAIVTSAQERGVPIISARQLLTWLDGRNSSSFGGFSWDGATLGFSVSVAAGAKNLQVLLPATVGTKNLTGLTFGGGAVPYSVQTLKGVSYATFAAGAGAYLATYTDDTVPPVISGLTVTPGTASAVVSWTTNEAATSQIEYGVNPGDLGENVTVSTLSTAHSLQLTGLTGTTDYYYRVTSADLNGTAAVQPAPAAPPAVFTTFAPESLGCPCTIWDPSVVPVQPSLPDPGAVELGLKIRSRVDGFVTAIRFYKGPPNTGVHTGHLWSSTGTLLATVAFSGETASGWQQATLATPIFLTANTTYVVSYHTDSGFYAGDTDFFSGAGVTRDPLTALANGADGPNGVYAYGTGSFPTATSNSANYWVDVVFDNAAVGDSTPPTVAGMTPADGSTGVALNTVVTATFSEDVNPATVTAANVELRGAGSVLVPSGIIYAQLTRTVTMQPTAALSPSATYTARVKGGATGIKDLAGNALALDRTSSFTTGAAADVTPPTVTGMTPPNASAGVTPATSVTATFSEDINPSTVTTANVELRDAGSGLVPSGLTYVQFTRTVTLHPNVLLAAGATYTARVKGGPTGIKDLAGNSLALDSASSFTIAAAGDVTPPTVVGMTPTTGSTGVAQTIAVTATFSEDINPSTVTAANVELRDSANGLVPGAISYAQSTHTVTLQPNTVLSAAATYTARVKGGPTGIKDLAGNALALDSTSSFTTGKTATKTTRDDFEGDRKADLAVFRPSTGTWYVSYSSLGYSADSADALQWGLAGDIPLAGDFDGDGKTDLTVWRPSTGTWYVRYSSLGYSDVNYGVYQWGLPGDVPLAGDFDGDGKTDLTVWRPSTGTWYVRYSSLGYSEVNYGGFEWGESGDVPLAGDFDGDGSTELAVFRPSIGGWFIRYSSLGYSVDSSGYYEWGQPGDVALTGDFDGDGRSEITVFRPQTGEWFVRDSSSGYSLDGYAVYQWGLPGDVPIAADFDGDGRIELAVFRPLSGEWFLRFSSLGYDVASSSVYRWGSPGDVAVH